MNANRGSFPGLLREQVHEVMRFNQFYTHVARASGQD
jgi:hypothetical protein